MNTPESRNSVSPHKVKQRQRRKMFAFVGIGQDEKTDVALRHDEYLAEIDPHGGGGGAKQALPVLPR